MKWLSSILCLLASLQAIHGAIDSGGGVSTIGSYTNHSSIGNYVASRARVFGSPANFTGQIQVLYATSNRSPQFSGYALSTQHAQPVTVALAKIRAKASDPDGDALQITGVSPYSANQGTLIINGRNLTYTPAIGFSGTDTFTANIFDSRGMGVTAEIQVEVSPPTEAELVATMESNPPRLSVLSGGRIGVGFFGIPGRAYAIERSTDLEAWSEVGQVTASNTGQIQFTDESPPQPNAFYRLKVK
jgi:hypothetical protein